MLLAVRFSRPADAIADGWPSRPIRLVEPSAPGAGSDLLARAMAERLGAALRRTVYVDNKPGDSGLVATMQRIHEEVNSIQATAELKGLMGKMNTEPPPPIWTSEQFRPVNERDLEERRRIAHESNIAID